LSLRLPENLAEIKYLLKKAGKRPEGLNDNHIFRGNLRDGVPHPQNIEMGVFHFS
jgi:hypothetical protein